MSRCWCIGGDCSAIWNCKRCNHWDIPAMVWAIGGPRCELLYIILEMGFALEGATSRWRYPS